MNSTGSSQPAVNESSSNASSVKLSSTRDDLAPIEPQQKVSLPKRADLSEYTAKTLKMFRVPRETIEKGSYSADVAELKYKADYGDLYAKWFYAQKMQEQLDCELDRRYPMHSSIPPEVAKEWFKKDEEVRQLIIYVLSEAQG